MRIIPLKPIFKPGVITPVCRTCQHLMPAGQDHVCETPQEKETREKLISDAALFSEFDLELDRG